MSFVVDAVLFDSDGVLVDSHGLVDRAWRQLAAEFDLDIDVLLAELAGVRAVDTLSRYLPPGRVDAAVRRLEDLEVELAGTTRALRGAPELLASLAPGRWAIVTSASRRLGVARWAGAGIPLPHHIVTAEDVARGKPDPEPFRTAAARIGVDPARCIVFEDSSSGGSAARATGTIVVAVGDIPWTFEPHARVPDLTRVTAHRGDDGRTLLALDVD